MGQGSRHLAGVVSVVALCTTGAACDSGNAADRAGQGSTARARSGPLAVEVDLEAGQRWTASGPLVEDGSFCAAGARHSLRILDPSTRDELTLSEVADRYAEARRQRRSADMIDVVEHSCFDGSGSFILEANIARGAWSAISGTGAYTEMTGSGTISWQPTDQGGPESLYLDGEVRVPAVDR